jgi:hypothetical protein
LASPICGAALGAEPRELRHRSAWRDLRRRLERTEPQIKQPASSPERDHLR